MDSLFRQDSHAAGRPRLQVALAGCVGLALSIAAAVIAMENLDGRGAALAAVGRASMVAVPVAVGMYAWYRRPQDRFGRVLVAVGCGLFLTTLSESGDSLAYSIGRVSGWVMEGALIWVVLAYPMGRLEEKADRMLFWIAVAVIGVLFLPTTLLAETYPAPSPFGSCNASCPDNAFFVLDSESAFVESVLLPARALINALLFLAVSVRLVQRMRGASTVMRRALAPVLTVASARGVVGAVAVVVRSIDPDLPAAEVFVWAYGMAVPALAAAFFLGLIVNRLFVADALQDLGLRVRTALSRNELREALSEALEDPSLELVYWVDGGRDRWVDALGHDVDPPPAGSDRWLTEIRDGDRLVAGIVHDVLLRDQKEFVDAVAAYSLIALENRRLAAKVAASLSEVRASRARIVASADRERRRIERDLHDGGQQRLVALGIQLELAEELLKTDPEAGMRKLEALHQDVNETLDEIRALAHGVYPPLLADRGLAEALRAAALRAPIPAKVDPDSVGRYPEAVESAVYFCCMEAMQNASKYASDASSIDITLSRDNGSLKFQVSDDGPGFDAGSARGVGLTNMKDRLAAVGGELDVRSAKGEGTVVTGRVPVGAS